ncbi:MAG: GNAT family N-acetyltransferase [Clostridia bacterium]
MIYNIRSMKREDATVLHHAFSRQGINKSLDLLLSYYSEQHRGDRKVLIAEYENEILGYLTILRTSKIGPYKEKMIPEIDDLNVLTAYQHCGLASYLIDKAEKVAVKYCDYLSVAISPLDTHGIAQTMFANRNYKFLATGLWDDDKKIELNDIVHQNIKIYMIKSLDKSIR